MNSWLRKEVDKDLKAVIIAVAIVVPLVLIARVAPLCCCYCRRRRGKDGRSCGGARRGDDAEAHCHAVHGRLELEHRALSCERSASRTEGQRCLSREGEPCLLGRSWASHVELLPPLSCVACANVVDSRVSNAVRRVGIRDQIPRSLNHNCVFAE